MSKADEMLRRLLYLKCLYIYICLIFINCRFIKNEYNIYTLTLIALEATLIVSGFSVNRHFMDISNIRCKCIALKLESIL